MDSIDGASSKIQLFLLISLLQFNSKINFLTDNHQLNLTDLCDDVLFEIFSYLNLHDGLRLPLVCKRFWRFIQQNNIPISAATSMDLETLKLKRKFNYDRVFQNLGSHLKKFTIDSNEDAFEVNLIMKSIGKYCHNVKTMIVRLLYANTVKSLPKSLYNLTVRDFRGKCLNISNLTHLQKLILWSSHELDEIKVFRILKEFHLKLQLGYYMQDYAKINRLTMVSEKFEVELHSDDSDAGYFYTGGIHTIAINDLHKIMNLKLFRMHLFSASVEGIDSTNIHSSKMFCNCGNYVPLSMNISHIILDDYHGPAPATKRFRYIPRTSLTFEFEFDDYEDRYKYFDRLHLGLPICHCDSVEVRILMQ